MLHQHTLEVKWDIQLTYNAVIINTIVNNIAYKTKLCHWH